MKVNEGVGIDSHYDMKLRMLCLELFDIPYESGHLLLIFLSFRGKVG